MWFIVVFVAITLTLVEAASVENVEKCLVLKHTTWKCCQPEYFAENRRNSTSDSYNNDENYKECIKLSKDSCERDNCFGIKNGLLTSDGKIDKKAAQEWFKNELSSVITSTEIANKILNRCIDGDLAIFGLPDTCDLSKLGQCLGLQIVINCPKWKTESSCEDVMKLADECSKLFA